MGLRNRSEGVGREDAFGDLIAKGTRNALDLPAFYDASSERWRFIENGTRVDEPDANSTRFTEQDQQWLLEPEASDTLQWKTAEAPRYIVGNDVSVTWAFKFASDLQDANDTLTLFVEDAFELEYDGADNVTLRSLENGSEKASTAVDLPTDRTNPTRPEIRFNWYAVGRLQVTIEYTDSNDQLTDGPTTLTVDDDWLSDAPVGRVGYELDVSNAGIQCEVGSVAYIPQTDTPPTARFKPFNLPSSTLPNIAADGWTALAAFRIDPNRENVFTDVNEIDIAAEASVDTQVWLKAVEASETDANFDDPDNDGVEEGPAAPVPNTDDNSVIQATLDVSTFPETTNPLTGNTVPDGRLIGIDTTSTSGQGAQSSLSTASIDIKRPVYPDDVVVILGNTPDASTATGVDILIGTEQDW